MLMEPEKVYSNHGMKKLIRSVQGDEIVWDLNERTLAAYCAQSLAPIGLVAREEMDEKGQWGYAKTEYGQKVGAPFAALLLDFSLKHPQTTLRELLGETQSRSADLQSGEKKRSPAVRSRLLRELLKYKEPVSVSELEIGLDESTELIAKHLRDLNESDLVSYQTIEAGQPQKEYGLAEERPTDEPPVYIEHYPDGRKYHQPRLTEDIYNFFLTNPDKKATIAQIAEILEGQYKEEGLAVLKSLKNNVAKVLAHLAKEGYLRKTAHLHDTRTQVSLSEQQRALLEEFIALIDEFQANYPESTERGQRMAIKLVNSPQDIAALLSKSKQKSPKYNVVGTEKALSLVEGFIKRKQGITNKELQKELLTLGIRTSPNRVSRWTAILEKEGKIRADQGTSKRFYTV